MNHKSSQKKATSVILCVRGDGGLVSLWGEEESLLYLLWTLPTTWLKTGLHSLPNLRPLPNTLMASVHPKLQALLTGGIQVLELSRPEDQVGQRHLSFLPVWS